MISHAYSFGLDVLGAARDPNRVELRSGAVRPHVDMVGSYDVAQLQRDMNQIKQVPVVIGFSLLRGGQQAIDRANAAVKQAAIMSALNTYGIKSGVLPGQAARDEVYWKLKWHADALAKQANTPTAIYGAGDDLKKWVMQSFIEWNAVETGVSAIDASWDQMWTDIKNNLAALPAAVAKVVTEAADTVSTAASWAMWIGIGVAALAAFTAYKVLTGPVGHVVIDRYIPRGRGR